MKRSFLFLFLLLTLIQCAKSPDFRQVEWGMDKTDIMKNETAELIATDIIDLGGFVRTNYNEDISFLTYKDEAFGTEIYLEYTIGIIGLSAVHYRFPLVQETDAIRELRVKIINEYTDQFGDPEIVNNGSIYHWKSKKYDVTLSYVTKLLLQFSPHTDKSFAQMVKEAQQAMKELN